MFPGLAQGESESLVLGNGLLQLAFRLEEFLLERADPPRGVLHAPAQGYEFLFETRRLFAQVRHLALVFVGWGR